MSDKGDIAGEKMLRHKISLPGEKFTVTIIRHDYLSEASLIISEA